MLARFAKKWVVYDLSLFEGRVKQGDARVVIDVVFEHSAPYAKKLEPRTRVYEYEHKFIG